MNIFNLLSSQQLLVQPTECKFHFARSSLQKDKDRFSVRDGFQEFQNYQTKRNFSRPFVVSFYEYGDGLWMFAGVWKVIGEPIDAGDHFQYTFEFLEKSLAFERRLIVSWPERFRNSYPNGETMAHGLTLHAILASPDELGRFPSYARTRLSFAALRNLVKNPAASINWKTALESVAGVYVIADTKNEKLYVGSACGKDNIWQRWSAYAVTGHGGNKALIKEHAERGGKVFDEYVFSLIWHADSSVTTEEVHAMETFWKEALLTRGSRGYNEN